MHEVMGGFQLWCCRLSGQAARGGGGWGSDAGPSFPVKSATTTSSLSAAIFMPFVLDGGNVMRACGQCRMSICRSSVADATDTKTHENSRVQCQPSLYRDAIATMPIRPL